MSPVNIFLKGDLVGQLEIYVDSEDEVGEIRLYPSFDMLEDADYMEDFPEKDENGEWFLPVHKVLERDGPLCQWPGGGVWLQIGPWA